MQSFILIIQCLETFSPVFTMKPFVHDDVLVLRWRGQHKLCHINARGGPGCPGAPGELEMAIKFPRPRGCHVNAILKFVVCILCVRSLAGSVFLVEVGAAS